MVKAEGSLKMSMGGVKDEASLSSRGGWKKGLLRMLRIMEGQELGS